MSDATIEELRVMVVRAYADREAARNAPNDGRDMSGETLANARKVLEMALKLYNEKAHSLFINLPMAATVRQTYNSRGHARETGPTMFGQRVHTFHIVPNKAYKAGAFVRKQGQPLCKVMKILPGPLDPRFFHHESTPTCHDCLVRAEKIVTADQEKLRQAIAASTAHWVPTAAIADVSRVGSVDVFVRP